MGAALLGALLRLLGEERERERPERDLPLPSPPLPFLPAAGRAGCRPASQLRPSPPARRSVCVCVCGGGEGGGGGGGSAPPSVRGPSWPLPAPRWPRSQPLLCPVPSARPPPPGLLLSRPVSLLAPSPTPSCRLLSAASPQPLLGRSGQIFSPAPVPGALPEPLRLLAGVAFPPTHPTPPALPGGGCAPRAAAQGTGPSRAWGPRRAGGRHVRGAPPGRKRCESACGGAVCVGVFCSKSASGRARSS